MTEIRGEAVHVCARMLLKYEKAKKGKTTLKLLAGIKTDVLGLSCVQDKVYPLVFSI